MVRFHIYYLVIFKCNCLVQIPRLFCVFSSLLSCLIVPKSWNDVYSPACTHFRFGGKGELALKYREISGKVKKFFLLNYLLCQMALLFTGRPFGQFKWTWISPDTSAPQIVDWKIKSREGTVFMLRFLPCSTAGEMSCHICCAVTRSRQDMSRRLCGNRIQADDGLNCLSCRVSMLSHLMAYIQHHHKQ